MLGSFREKINKIYSFILNQIDKDYFPYCMYFIFFIIIIFFLPYSYIIIIQRFIIIISASLLYARINSERIGLQKYDSLLETYFFFFLFLLPVITLRLFFF